MSDTPRTDAKERESEGCCTSFDGAMRHAHYGWKLARKHEQRIVELERRLALAQEAISTGISGEHAALVRAEKAKAENAALRKEYQEHVAMIAAKERPAYDEQQQRISDMSSRLQQIANVIIGIDNRCMAADGPVLPTHEEITLDELKKIWKLAAIDAAIGKPSPVPEE